MDTIKITDVNGKETEVSEVDFQRAMVQYMRETSPDHIKLIAEEINDGGRARVEPTLVMFITKNPSELSTYTADVIPLVQEREEVG